MSLPPAADGPKGMCWGWAGNAYIECDGAVGLFQVVTPFIRPAALSLGRHSLDVTGGNPAAVLLPAQAPQAPCEYLPPAPTFAEVTHAVGGSAPYPAAVTADYACEVSIHLEWDSSVATAESPPTCPPIGAVVDFQLVETAADAVNYPHAACELP